jgi:hypothetical protein
MRGTWIVGAASNRYGKLAETAARDSRGRRRVTASSPATRPEGSRPRATP